MKISVIIPCKNEAGVVDKLLKSLVAQTRGADQIVVVNSHSTDDTVAHARRFADELPLITVDAREKGVAHARNDGAAAASGDMFVFIDADATLPPSFLADFEQTVTRKQFEVGGFTQKMNSKKLSIRVGAHLMNGYLRLMSHTPWPIAFSCLFATRQAFAKLRGFDPEIYIMEDYDLALRARRAGFRVGVVSSPFIGSDRRFIENPSQAWRSLYGEWYRYTHGLRVTRPIYDYAMGGKTKKKS